MEEQQRVGTKQSRPTAVPKRSSDPTKPIFLSDGVPVRRSPAAVARRFFQICTTATVETLAGEDLTPLQFGVLAYLNRETGEPDLDQNGLAARLGIDRASTSQIVDELEARGLVDRRVNGADRRARLLRLTPRGEKLQARLQPVSSARQTRIFASLSSAERELLLDLLIRVIQTNPTLARPGAARRKRGFRKSLPDNS
jgi:DNA-binding MarR family transcriptional regulator